MKITIKTRLFTKRYVYVDSGHIFNYRLTVIGFQLSVIGFQLSVIGYQLSVIGFQLLLIDSCSFKNCK